MKTLFLQRLMLAGLFCGAATFLTAQGTGAVPTCDAVVNSAQTEIQKQADASCQTVTKQVACTDKRSGKLMFTTLVAQPRCKSFRNAKTQAATGNRAKAGAPATATSGSDTNTKPGAPYVDIMQRPCEAGTGLDLEVFIPGNAMRCDKDRYTFLWEVDGGKGGHAAQLECICGRKAKVVVTDTQTGLSTTKEIDLMGCRN